MNKLYLAEINKKFLFISESTDKIKLKNEALELEECSNVKIIVNELDSLAKVPKDVLDFNINATLNNSGEETDVITNLSVKEFFEKFKTLKFLKEKLNDSDFEAAKNMILGLE